MESALDATAPGGDDYCEETAGLNDEQLRAFNLCVVDKTNVFITSAAGCGKSFIIKRVYETLRRTLVPGSDIVSKNPCLIGLTSTTGVSAQVIGGVTLHSFLGIGIGGSYATLLNKIMKNSATRKRWRELHTLIIDEISMISPDLFETLEALARNVRGNNKPFGGIQLILTGDFMQLPPVEKIKGREFVFKSPVWKTCVTRVVVLKKIMRQRDADFISALANIRMGDITDECRKLIGSREIKYTPPESHDTKSEACDVSDVEVITPGEVKPKVIPTKLYPVNSKVDACNEKYYNKLPGEEHVYNINFEWQLKLSSYDREKLESTTRYPGVLKLKVGAQVMHLANIGVLVNGSRGVVTEFVNGFPKVKFHSGVERVITPTSLDVEREGEKIMSYKQIPLKLAWAATIHKTQGCTLDLVCVNFKQTFEYGQFYVALSRCSDLRGLYVKNLDWNLVKVHPDCLAYYKSLA